MAIEKKTLQGTSSFPSKPIEPLGSILNHLPMVIFIVIGCLAAGIGGVVLKVKPSYQAEAIIKIEPVISKILYGQENASITPYYDDFVRTQISLVKGFPILSSAIELYEAQGPKWRLADESIDQAVGRLTGRLDIKQLRDTQLFSLSMSGRRKEGLAEIINAVARTYLKTNKDEQLNKDAARLIFLKKRRNETEQGLQVKYGILQNISAQYAVGITDEKNLYVYLQAIVDLTQQLVKATSRRIETESKLKEMGLQRNVLKSIDISADIDDWVEKDWAIRDNRIQLSRKLQNMRLILAGVNQEHPDRKEYEQNLQKLYEVQENLLKRARKVGEKVIRGKLLSDQNKKILELKTEYAAALKTEAKLRSELTSAEHRATDINTQMMKAATLRKNIQRLQDALLRIDERIDQIEVESRSPGRIFLKTKARTPEKPSGGKPAKMMIIVVLFSFLGGIGYAVFRDKLDTRILSTKDVRRVLGFPATGFVMEAAQDLEKIKDIYHAVMETPFAQTSEQYKGIAFALSAEHESHKSRIYTAVSIGPQQGTSSFLINTLCALKGSRHKKILVDLNIRSPIGPKLVPESDLGLWDVMEGRGHLKEAIVSESKYPFHILPFGNWVQQNLSPFQELGLGTIIETLRIDYEYIMIDSPPLTVTTDAKFLARLAEVTILVVQSEAVAENELFRWVRELDKARVKVISVILNRVKLQRGRYYKSAMEQYYRLVPPVGKNHRGASPPAKSETTGSAGPGEKQNKKSSKGKFSLLIILGGVLMVSIFWGWDVLATLKNLQPEVLPSYKIITRKIDMPPEPELETESPLPPQTQSLRLPSWNEVFMPKPAATPCRGFLAKACATRQNENFFWRREVKGQEVERVK